MPESTAKFERAGGASACFAIRELEIISFKSFREKVTITFPTGVTCISGPNGSGKSNIFDAIDWVLGKEFQNVIFAGSVLYPPAEFAQVTATFDNRSCRLNIKADNVTISRAMNRHGEKYFILNGKHLTASEVEELFQENGRGIPSYARLERHRMDLLFGDSRHRRKFFDKALGFSIFRRQMREASAQCKKAQANLTRIRDIHCQISHAMPENPAEIKHLKEMSDHQLEQINVLSSSLNELKIILTEKRAEASRRLEDSVKEVSDKFSTLIDKIWPRSSAEILFIDKNRPLTSDIEIRLSLSGQPATALSRLSGGDKANAAIVLMFALCATHLPHFCVLDGTDSLLDDENINRFFLILKEFAAETQIILTTHRKKIPGHIPTIYRLSTDEPA